MHFTKAEEALFKKINTPAKIQTFLNSIPFNFEKNGETLKSPLFTIRDNKAHCFEGALLGAYALSRLGYKPLVLHLQATKNDFDHVIAPFQQGGFWGALSKTNHAVLRYREPVYKTIRELVMSYFHEYFLNDGTKTLRKYSMPLNLHNLKIDWISHMSDLWLIDKELDKVKHYDILSRVHLDKLRKADAVEIQAGKIEEFKK